MFGFTLRPYFSRLILFFTTRINEIQSFCACYGSTPTFAPFIGFGNIIYIARVILARLISFMQCDAQEHAVVFILPGCLFSIYKKGNFINVSAFWIKP